MCLGDWSSLGLVHASDIDTIMALPLVPKTQGDENGDVLLPDNFADIVIL